MMSCEGDVDKGGDCGERMVRWENLMPKVSLTVLLVESDESTRQVIAALLRKCCYKVAAVSDGLKAWEVLKRRPNCIDLILTEMDLPAISGFALLTLIMENDSCKNIPVIMMSKNDSVNMVYNCMMRGAADFLVKPVRKNELQNLWQHIWRRQASTRGGQRIPDESITQQKIEGPLDDDLVIVESNDECKSENGECNEKGNDAQSSCSVPVLGAEITYKNAKDIMKSKCSELLAHDTLNESELVRGHVAVYILNNMDSRLKKPQEDCQKFVETSDNNDALINNSRPVIDFMGTFQNYSTKSSINSTVVYGTSGNDSNLQLELSLRGSSGPRDPQHLTLNERRNAVHQSNASAFSRYKASKPVHRTHASDRPQECEGSSNKHMSSPIQTCNSHIPISHQNTQASSVYQKTSDSRQVELSFYCHQQRMLQDTVQVDSLKLDRTCTSSSSNQMAQRQDVSLDIMEHQKNISSVNERSQNSSLCNNGVLSLNGFGGGSVCGNNGSRNAISTQDEEPNRSLQREAALIKFRQKRKDRCFEKKIRYESRKKLAEKRLRVKGQFVRQVQTEPSTVTTADL